MVAMQGHALIAVMQFASEGFVVVGNESVKVNLRRQQVAGIF